MNARSAWLRVESDHPALAGHFPGHPIVPGALLLDEALHAIDAAETSWHIANLKFHRIVRPVRRCGSSAVRNPAVRCASNCEPLTPSS